MGPCLGLFVTVQEMQCLQRTSILLAEACTMVVDTSLFSGHEHACGSGVEIHGIQIATEAVYDV